VPVITAVAALALLAGSALALSFRKPSPHSAASVSPNVPGATVPATSAHDFDPFGGDHSEHPETVGNAIDGNPDTTWSTSRYDQQFTA